MTDPYTLLFIAACTAIAGVVAPIVAEYAKSRFSDHSGKASLQATNTELIKRISDREADFNKRELASQEQIAVVQAKYDQCFSREAILAKYSFDQLAGLYTHGQFHFCPHCLHETPQVQSPMKNEKSGWRCGFCHLYFSRPQQ